MPSIKVILIRRVPIEKSHQLKPLLMKLRSLAMAQTGYISGETLMNADDPEEYLVISSWASLDDWDAWFHNDERQRVQEDVDQLLGHRTLYQIYYNA